MRCEIKFDEGDIAESWKLLLCDREIDIWRKLPQAQILELREYEGRRRRAEFG